MSDNKSEKKQSRQHKILALVSWVVPFVNNLKFHRQNRKNAKWGGEEKNLKKKERQFKSVQNDKKERKEKINLNGTIYMLDKITNKIKEMTW